jgi:hypothetical protein
LIDFNFKGISITASVRMEQSTYKDVGGHDRSRFDKDVTVSVQFWDFVLRYGDLYELTFVKATLNYFMQSYWKRSNKHGAKIELAKVLHRKDYHGNQQALCFVARQKNKRNYLHITQVKKGETDNEVYLDGQEVIMLDIAIGKAINLLSPKIVESGVSIF